MGLGASNTLYEIFLHLTWSLPFIGALQSLLLSRAEKIRNYAAASMLALSAVSSTLLLLSYLSAGANEFSYKWISSIGANLEFNVDGLSVFMANKFSHVTSKQSTFRR